MPFSDSNEVTTFCHESQYFASDDFELDEEQPATIETASATAASAIAARLSGDFFTAIPPCALQECGTDQVQVVGNVSPAT
jgi:ATP-dependent exoDNAse (exonuclease V) alpha subunit